MQDNTIWITKNGVHIPIKTKEQYFNDNFYMQDGDFYQEWREKYPDKNWGTKYPWGEEKRIDVYDKKNNKQVAYLKYKEVKDYSKTSMKDKINVVNIFVDDKYRRKGIATQLYKELQRRTGDEDINFGEFSKEGKELVESIGKITKVEKNNYNYYWGRINL